jgi:transposase InsO family protein
MITKEAKRRMKILVHWERYGMESTLHAYEVTERTLWYWKQRFEKEGRRPEALNPRSRAPRKKRTRTWHPEILAELRRLRTEHPNIGKEKLYPELATFVEVSNLGECPKPSTIGRLLKDLGGLRSTPQKITGTGRVVKVQRQKVSRKPKGFKATYPGHCIALDTIEKQQNGRRMYVLTAIDLYTRTAFALGTCSHSSKTAAHFFSLAQTFFPYPINTVLTDNGSEFKKHFRELMKSQRITHYHTYPKTPKMNAHVESFNGTIQAEFVDFHQGLLFADITDFNTKLNEYLLFYNTRRVHSAFKNKLTPFAVLNRSAYYVSQLPEECKNGWTQSIAFKIAQKALYCLQPWVLNSHGPH